MLKINSINERVELAMTPEVLSLSLEIGRYIDENFDKSDFFTIQNTTQESLQEFVAMLGRTQTTHKADVANVSLTLSKAQYQLFQSLFHHADTFLDEVPALEDKIDTIEKIADLLLPPISKR
jgi:CRISPR/Cas system CSM-associated protein Csm2 small subunit